MKHRLEGELARREANLTDRGHERPSDVRVTFCDDEIVSAMRELVRLENASLHHREVFQAAEDAMKRSPDTLTNSIVLHFGKLFDVKKLEGMFPKINVRIFSVDTQHHCPIPSRHALADAHTHTCSHCDALRDVCVGWKAALNLSCYCSHESHASFLILSPRSCTCLPTK